MSGGEVIVLIGFKRQFAPFVIDGSKRHTIRAKRADGKIPAVGEILHCYVDPRQKTMALLGRWPCLRVDPIIIEPLWCGPPEARFIQFLKLTIAGAELSLDEANDFLWRDGFRREDIYPPIAQARDFWRTNLMRGSWTGNLIHWAYDMPYEGK